MNWAVFIHVIVTEFEGRIEPVLCSLFSSATAVELHFFLVGKSGESTEVIEILEVKEPLLKGRAD